MKQALAVLAFAIALPLSSPAHAYIKCDKIEKASKKKKCEKKMDKKKAWEAIQPKLVTNSEGVAMYEGAPFTVAGGVCSAPIKDGIIS